MRKFGLFLLLATSAMPALAQQSDEDRQSRRASQADQSESSAERPERAARPERAQRPERAERSERRERREQAQRQIQGERQDQVEGRGQVEGGPNERVRQQQRDGSRSERMEQYRQQMQQRQQQDQQDPQAAGSSEQMQRYQQQMQERRQQEDQRREQGQSGRTERLEQWRQRQIDGNPQDGGVIQRDRRDRPVAVIRPEPGQVGPVRTDVRRIGRDGRYEPDSRVGNDGRDVRDGRRYDRDGRRYDRDNRSRWSNNWRNDRRYDWRNHRNRNRSTFSIGFYFDPFGFNYRRFGIGSYLYSGYYQSNYWINDPWQYRLPPAYGPYRWVRYHNDAVMIDTWSGEVVDVIYGFFW